RLSRTHARLLLVAALAGAFALAGAPAALAACHAFSVTASPSTVAEGKAVTVTVSRDGAVAPSSIHLSTVDGTAKAGSDYKPLDVTVSFTNDTERQFTLSTIDDHVQEKSETLSLHLSNPAGCFGSGYVVGPDARVTIADNDTPRPTPTKTSTAKATVEPTVAATTPRPTPSAKPSPRASTTNTPSTTPSPARSTITAAPAATTGSSNGIWLGTAVGLILVVSAGGYAFRRRRTRS
ncbi:MAG: Calx-beta domain-containing protein, partial [Actinomycetota bacterium]